MPFAVNVDEVATPDGLVVTVCMFGVELSKFANVPLCPVAGAVKVTWIPLGTGFPYASFTRTDNGLLNA